MSKDTSVYFVLSFFFNSGSSDDTSKNLLVEAQVDSDSHKKEGLLNHVMLLLLRYYLHLFLLSSSQLGLPWCLHETTGSHKNFHG